MKTKQKLLCLILLCVMVLPFCVSCSSGNGNPAETTAPDGTKAESTSAEEVETEETFDYRGETITFMERELSSGTNIYYEVYAPEVSAEVISNAIYQRNQKIQLNYHVKLESYLLPASNGSRRDTVSNDIKSGTGLYNVLLDYGGNTMNYAIDGYVYDLNALDHFDFTKDCWYTNTMEDTRINGKNAFAVGDICTASYTATALLFFNKSLAEQYHVEDCYKLVFDGKWTYDKFRTVGLAVTQDLDGGGMGMNDQYMMAAANWNWQPYFYGQGYKLVTVNSDGFPVLGELGEGEIDVLKSITELVRSENCWYLSSYPGASTANIFKNQQALFWTQLMVGCNQLRDAEFDFGVLPLPKRDEAQKDYISYLHTKTSLLSIPATVQDDRLDMIAHVLEGMCEISQKIVKPAYFDVLFDGIIARDEETTKMLDIVYSNLFMDLVQPLGQVGLTIDTTFRNILDMNLSGAIVSAYNKALKANQAILDSVVDAYDEKLK